VLFIAFSPAFPGICAFAALPPVPVQLPVDCLDKQPFEGPGIPDQTGKGSGCRMLEIPTLWDPCIYGVCTLHGERGTGTVLKKAPKRQSVKAPNGTEAPKRL